MGLSLGIVGLPNVGKSTLFNALTRLKAQASNYPFCTIDPNVGVVEVPDERLQALATVVNPKKIVPATIEFVDIAGLVKNAHEGEGLGNQFLTHIRNTDAICQVVRQFKDADVTHVEGEVSPRRDIEIIETELILSDLQVVEKRIERVQKMAKTGDKVLLMELETLQQIRDILGQGKWLFREPGFGAMAIDDPRRELMRELALLSWKPMMYAVNVGEEELASFSQEQFKHVNGLSTSDRVIPICAKVEHELNELSADEAAEYLKSLGITEGGLTQVIREGYDLLGLITFFTAGEKEVRAWTLHRGLLAPQAAGVIHTDFEKAFIRVEVVRWQDLVEAGSYLKAREKGLIRTEGKQYVITDGDTVHFLHSA